MTGTSTTPDATTSIDKHKCLKLIRMPKDDPRRIFNQEVDGVGLWVSNGVACYLLQGTQAEWMTLMIEADAIDRGLTRQPTLPGNEFAPPGPDINRIYTKARVDARALYWTHTILALGDERARVLVGPDGSGELADGHLIDERFIAPLSDAGSLRWMAQSGMESLVVAEGVGPDGEAVAVAVIAAMKWTGNLVDISRAAVAEVTS